MVEAAAEKGILATSNMSDQSNLAPDTVIMGPVWDMWPTVKYVISLMQALAIGCIPEDRMGTGLIASLPLASSMVLPREGEPCFCRFGFVNHPSNFGVSVFPTRHSFCHGPPTGFRRDWGAVSNAGLQL